MWVKNYVDNFDLTLGSFNSAQIADLVAIYILDTLGRIVNFNQIGLYRDDESIFIQNSNGPKTSKLQKKIIRAFRSLGLRIEISFNLEIVNFLGVTFNLDNKSFKPFDKNNHVPTYININSNHPRSIIKQIPNAINLRLFSSKKNVFWLPKDHLTKPYITVISTKNLNIQTLMKSIQMNITTIHITIEWMTIITIIFILEIIRIEI